MVSPVNLLIPLVVNRNSSVCFIVLMHHLVHFTLDLNDKPAEENKHSRAGLECEEQTHTCNE